MHLTDPTDSVSCLQNPTISLGLEQLIPVSFLFESNLSVRLGLPNDSFTLSRQNSTFISLLSHVSRTVCLFPHTFNLIIQGLSKRFERFKFGIFYVLIVKIRYNFTHK